jgi:uncharacterized protein YqhQ
MQKKTTIGGQALLEGLMMVGPERIAMAVRKPDGEIFVDDWSVGRLSKAATIPFVRGSVRLFRQLVTGTKALMRSAEFIEEAPEVPVEGAPAKEPQKPSRFDRFFEKHTDLLLYGSVLIGLMFSVGLFILLPNFLVTLIGPLAALKNSHTFGDTIVLNLVEGVVRIVLFVAYLSATSLMKDIRRVWMYHGAEHKTISCYESGLPLTVENVRTFSTRHPRCGTSFLFIVLLISIIVFSFFGWWGMLINLAIRLALLPVVAGIGFEIIRWTGRHEKNPVARVLSAPGLLLQGLTTREPDDGMLEVAIAATERVIPEKKDADVW